ncbi:MAG: hypothetical protein JSW39_27020 [Desulfobacterales bacterium]|nr:MAG: hypothetical protein JSW39_27020 [Desulfobacterales bacterium]
MANDGNPSVASTEEEIIAPEATALGAGRFRRMREGVAVVLASKIAVIGLGMVLFWVFVAVFAPLLTPYTPLEQDWKAPNQGPSQEHLLGTDELGRDLWARLIYGARVVLVVLPLSENLWLPGGTGSLGGLCGPAGRHDPGAGQRLLRRVAG